MRCYASRFVAAVFASLLLAALAAAWIEQHLALWPNRSADDTVSVPVSQTAPDPACCDYVFDAMGAEYHGGAVVTAC